MIPYRRHSMATAPTNLSSLSTKRNIPSSESPYVHTRTATNPASSNSFARLCLSHIHKCSEFP